MMNKFDKQAALFGIVGTLLTGYTFADETSASSQEMVEQKPMDESAFVEKLSANAKRIYEAIDPEGQKISLQIANQSCAGKNVCRGFNACKTQTNSCAGLGSCKGTTVGPTTNPDHAVQAAAIKMAQKRHEMNK